MLTVAPRVIPALVLALFAQDRPRSIGWIWVEPSPSGTWPNYPPWTSGFGHRLTALDDLDEDGVPELEIAAPLDLAPWSEPGRVFVVSGRTGGLLSMRDMYVPVYGFQLEAGRSVDLDGDGLGESFVPGWEDEPVRVISSATGKTSFQLTHSPFGGYFEGFGQSVASAGDLNGDGVTDLAVGCSEFQVDRGDGYVVELYSGRDGTPIGGLDCAGKSVTVARAVDFDADGHPDLLIGLPEDESVIVLNGRSLGSRLGIGLISRGEWPVLLTFRRTLYPSGAPFEPFPVLPTPCRDR